MAENHTEMLAKCRNSAIALVAVESAKAERPRSILPLRVTTAKDCPHPNL